LKEHTLISDFAIRLDAIIKHYEWELDQAAFSSEEQSGSVEWLTVLGDKIDVDFHPPVHSCGAALVHLEYVLSSSVSSSLSSSPSLLDMLSSLAI
jgi:hypothetical protein